MEIERKATVQDLSLELSIMIIDYERGLSPDKKGNVTNQVLRSGTAIGAMICEGQGCESKKDFVHKMKIAYKEAVETEYWLVLQEHISPSEEIRIIRKTVTRVMQMLGKILSACSRTTTCGKREK